MKRMFSIMFATALILSVGGCAGQDQAALYQKWESEHKDAWIQEGYENGYDEGNASGYEEGYQVGRQDGYNLGYEDGELDGLKNGQDQGYQDGYASGLAVGSVKVSEPKPQEPAAVTADTSEPVAQMVYITKTGSKYHRDGCSYLKSRIEISLEDAKARGYEPCSRCGPPR